MLMRCVATSLLIIVEQAARTRVLVGIAQPQRRGAQAPQAGAGFVPVQFMRGQQLPDLVGLIVGYVA